MLYLTIWFIHGIFNLFFKVFLTAFCFFLSSSFSFIFNIKKLYFLSYFSWLIFPLIFVTQTPNTFFLFSISIFLANSILVIKLIKFQNLKSVFWFLNKQALIKAIKIREIIFISDWIYFFLLKIKNYFFFFFFLLLFIIFCSFHQLFITLTFLFFILSAILRGLSLRFFSNFISLLIYKPQPKKPSNSPSLPALLKEIIDSHPLNATIEESFFEDNLQIGEFFLVYPIFYKAHHPSPDLLTYEQEIINVWHLIRWESALSKQTGSAASRWSSLFSINSIPAQGRIHSIHTPLVPIYRDKLFSIIILNNLPYFDPFNQPPNWSPYLIITHFLRWDEDDINEERINEIEEEE